MMFRAVRILAFVFLALGFPLHGFVGAVAAVHASTCVALSAAEGATDGGQAVPETPGPSCKLIGAAGSDALERPPLVLEARRPVMSAAVFSAVWPQGPEKPPKRG